MWSGPSRNPSEWTIAFNVDEKPQMQGQERKQTVLPTGPTSQRDGPTDTSGMAPSKCSLPSRSSPVRCLRKPL